MSKKSEKIAALIQGCQGQSLDAHYLGYFACFNEQLFYEAHDVLEELWLAERKGPDDSFYKGLIQFAGAFVHLQKNRLRPAAALFKLSRSYLSRYPGHYKQLDLAHVLRLTEEWVGMLEKDDYQHNPLNSSVPPRLHLANVSS